MLPAPETGSASTKEQVVMGTVHSSLQVFEQFDRGAEVLKLVTGIFIIPYSAFHIIIHK